MQPVLCNEQPRLAFCMQNRSFRLYSNTAVVPQEVFDKAILHEVHNIIDAKWRTNFYLHQSQSGQQEAKLVRKMRRFKFLRDACARV